MRLVAACLACVAFVAAAAAAQEARRPAAQLTFTEGPRSDPDNGLYRICIARSDGKQRRRIVRGSVWAASADWSPDGSEVAFTGIDLPAGLASADDSDIVVADASGRLLRNLSAGFSHSNFAPRWSADGKWIAFVSDVLEPTIVPADGSAPPQLVPVPDFAGDIDWFPDGRLVVSKFVGDGIVVFSVNRDGSGLRRLAAGNEPAVSPNGRRLAFVRVVRRNRHVFVSNADGKGAHRLTRTSKPEADPAWSPDGRWLAYERLIDPQAFFPHSSIVVTRSDGKRTYVAVTDKRYDPVVPGWRSGGALPVANRASC